MAKAHCGRRDLRLANARIRLLGAARLDGTEKVEVNEAFEVRMTNTTAFE